VFAKRVFNMVCAGWYDASVLERIEKRIQGRFQALLAKFRQDKDKVPPTTGDVAEAPSPMELDNATPTAGGSADDAADVPEHDKNPEIGGQILTLLFCRCLESRQYVILCIPVYWSSLLPFKVLRNVNHARSG
jgi:hypothetical protein